MTRATHGYPLMWTAMSRCGMAAKVQAGELPGCAPVGYLNRRDGNHSVIIIDVRTAPYIKKTFQLAGEGKLSLRAILQIITADGLKSRNGKALGVSALWNILTNPFYTGKIRYQGRLLSGNHRPLIDDTLFELVQDRLRNRQRRDQ